MSGETKGDHDSLNVSKIIELLRLAWLLGDEANADKIYRKQLIPACKRWVMSGRSIPWQDVEDITSQAIARVLEDLRSPDLSAEIVSLRLKKALNTVRAEYRRTATVEQGYDSFEDYEVAFRLYEEVSFEAQIYQADEQTRHEQRLLKVLDRLHGFLEISLERLRPRDYAILNELYKFDELGMPEAAESSPLSQLKASARRVAVHRARQRFLVKLHETLNEAFLSLEEEAAVLEDVIKLIEGGFFEDAIALQRQKVN